MYQDKEDSEIAQIVRDKKTKSAKLLVRTTQKWVLYGGMSIKSIDYTIPILQGEGSGDFLLNVANIYRSYFSFHTDTDSKMLAETHLPMAGGYNFRDLGGIKAYSGKHIKWGKLFRADEMSSLTDEDLTYLAGIPITSVVDFRAHGEVRRTPDKLPTTVRYTYPIAIIPGNMSKEGLHANLLRTDLDAYMEENNRLFVSEAHCVRAFKSLFTIIQNNLSAPVIYHCTAGKDRTGIATALILAALGVDEETIMQDYLSSKEYLEDKYATFIEKYPLSEPLFTVKKEYLEAGFDQIKKQYGDIHTFLTNELNVDIDRLRSMYLIEED